MNEKHFEVEQRNFTSVLCKVLTYKKINNELIINGKNIKFSAMKIKKNVAKIKILLF